MTPAVGIGADAPILRVGPLATVGASRRKASPGASGSFEGRACPRGRSHGGKITVAVPDMTPAGGRDWCRYADLDAWPALAYVRGRSVAESRRKRCWAASGSFEGCIWQTGRSVGGKIAVALPDMTLLACGRDWCRYADLDAWPGLACVGGRSAHKAPGCNWFGRGHGLGGMKVGWCQDRCGEPRM